VHSRRSPDRTSPLPSCTRRGRPVGRRCAIPEAEGRRGRGCLADELNGSRRLRAGLTSDLFVGLPWS
jgi:hypothetical protein